MARPVAGSLEPMVKKIVAGVVARIAVSVERMIEERVAQELKARLWNSGRAQRRGTRSRRRIEMTRWVADRRARRVPTFVIELTGGIDTKKKIVAKYGEGVVFEKGKPAPKPSKAA